MPTKSTSYLLAGEDIAVHVGDRMKKAGVAGFPRNYALFYQAFVEENGSLRAKLEGLPRRPPQIRLDELFNEIGSEYADIDLLETMRERITNLSVDVTELLQKERCSLERYAELLDCSANGGAFDKANSQHMLQRISQILMAATKVTVDQARERTEDLAKRESELQKIKKELEDYKFLAETDELTQLGNRRRFNRQLEAVFADSRRRTVSTLVMLDIDRFKALNDRHGHQAGDQVLKTVASILKSKCGSHVSIFRIGGEEFALLVEGLTDSSAYELADRIRVGVANHSFEAVAPKSRVTLSGGICRATLAINAEDLFAKADRALYASKASGRNRVTLYPIANNKRPEPKQQERKKWMLYETD